MSEIKVIHLLSAGGGDRSASARVDGELRRERLERVSLDEVGLGDVLGGFGLDESHAGIELIWLRDGEGPPGEGALGELQRATREEVAFERAEPAIEIVAYVHRVAGLTREQFEPRYLALADRLREETGPARLMCRYAQSFVLGDGEGPDAVGELGFSSVEDMRSFLVDAWLFEVLLPYEAQFIDHSRSVTMLVRRLREDALG